jgi:MtN3 and saliva related transmembrane protein
MSSNDILGYVAGSITAVTFLPQVIKTWKKRSAEDVSLMMFVIAVLCEVLWIIYAININNWVIILTNATLMVMALTMIYFKFRFNK